MFCSVASPITPLAHRPITRQSFQIPQGRTCVGLSPFFSKTALPLRKTRKSNALSDPNQADKKSWGRSWTVDILTNRMHLGYCPQTSRVAWEKRPQENTKGLEQHSRKQTQTPDTQGNSLPVRQLAGSPVRQSACWNDERNTRTERNPEGIPSPLAADRRESRRDSITQPRVAKPPWESESTILHANPEGFHLLCNPLRVGICRGMHLFPRVASQPRALFWNAAGVLFTPTHRSKNLPQNRIGGDT